MSDEPKPELKLYPALAEGEYVVTAGYVPKPAAAPTPPATSGPPTDPPDPPAYARQLKLWGLGIAVVLGYAVLSAISAMIHRWVGTPAVPLPAPPPPPAVIMVTQDGAGVPLKVTVVKSGE